MTAISPSQEHAAERVPLAAVITDEGFRLFFPLAALQLSCWPMLWVWVHGFDLPFARSIPPGFWHAHEMLIGGFGAALIGFITTAVPEWTDTDRLRGWPLIALAVPWAAARLIGLAGADALVAVAAVCDAAWLSALAIYVLRVSRQKRTTRLLAFAGWIAGLAAAEIVLRATLATGQIDMAQMLIRVVALLFTGLLGLALARITVPVTNLVLDPTERTSPFRPHPGRMNVAPSLAAVVIAGEILGLSPSVQGYLWIAAGAAFMDRVAEAFIGRLALRAEILGLAGAAALAGLGLMTAGAGRLGAAVAETTALHVLLMGGIGLGLLSVFAIAGQLHTGQKLGFTARTKIAMLLLVTGTALRVMPDFGFATTPGPLHGTASLIWAATFLVWLWDYWPALSDPKTLGAHIC